MLALRSHEQSHCRTSVRRSLGQEEHVDDVRRAEENATQATGNRAGYAEWIALGAVVAGSVGAIVGAARCSHRGARMERFETARPEPATLTAPHGDKLSTLL
jgi:hypothetical protein